MAKSQLKDSSIIKYLNVELPDVSYLNVFTIFNSPVELVIVLPESSPSYLASS